MKELGLQYPVKYVEYKGRPLPGTKDKRFAMDVCSFLMPNDRVVGELAGKITRKAHSPDEKAHAIQKWIARKLKYVSDDVKGCSEYWMFPPETIELMKGDCEDGAILIASLLLSVLPDYAHHRVWVAAGMVKPDTGAAGGGHAYCVYIRESDNQPVILDWCYYEDSRVAVEKKPIATEVSTYKEVWFAFNHKESRSPRSRTLSGRSRDGA